MEIDVYQDIVCPWCRIGDANLQQALAGWTTEPVTVHYRPFQLDPQAGTTPEPLATYFQRRGMGSDAAHVSAPVARAGDRAGLHFKFDRVQMVNTFNAHRLFALLPAEQHHALLAALHRALFEDGANINDFDVLADAAAAAGADRAAIRAALQTNAGVEETRAALERASGVVQGGVPFFVFDNTWALSGAQPPETLRMALDQIAAERAAR